MPGLTIITLGLENEFSRSGRVVLGALFLIQPDHEGGILSFLAVNFALSDGLPDTQGDISRQFFNNQYV